MKLSRRTLIAAAAASPIAAPMVARAGTYAVKVQNDGFAAVLETRDFMALASDDAAAAEFQRLLDKHWVLHVRPEAPLTRESVGRMAYHLGYVRNADRPARANCSTFSRYRWTLSRGLAFCAFFRRSRAWT